MRLLITGASGFLGSALARDLQERGHEVALLLRPRSLLFRLEGRSFDICRYERDADLQAYIARVKPEAIIHTACALLEQGWPNVLTICV